MPIPTAGLRATQKQVDLDALAAGPPPDLDALAGKPPADLDALAGMDKPLSLEAQIQRGGAVATPAPTREELSGKLQDVWTETFNAETRAGRPNDAEKVAWDVVNSIRHVPAGDTRGKNFGAIAGGIGIPAPGADPFEAAGVMAQQVTTPGSAANRLAEAVSPRWFSEDTYGVQDTVGWRVAESQAERERAMNLRAANDIRAGVAPDEAKRAARERLNSGAALLLPTSANPDTALAQADTPMEFATLPTTLRESAVDLTAGSLRGATSVANTLKDATVDVYGYAMEKLQGALGLDEGAAGSRAVRDWTFPDPVDALIRYYESIPEDEMTPERQADLMRLREGSFFTGMAGLHNAVVPDWVDPIDPRDAGLLNTVARVVTSKNAAQMPQVAGEDVVESITSTAPEAVKKYGEATEKFYGYLGGDVTGEDALSAAGSAGAAIGKAIKEPLSTGIGALSTTPEGRESTTGWWMRVGGTALSAPVTTYAARVLDKTLTSMGAESYRKHRVPWEDQQTGGGYAHALARKMKAGDTGHDIADWAETLLPILDDGSYVQDVATTIWNGDSIMPETMRALDTLAKGTKWFSPETTASMQPGGNIYEIATTLGMIGDLALPMDGIVPHLVKEPLVRASRFTDGYLAGKMLAMPPTEAAKVGLAHSIPSVADRILRNNPEYVAAHAALSGQVDRPAAPGVSVFTGRDTDAPAVTNAAAMAWFKKQYALGRDPVEVLRTSEDPGHRVVADRMAEMFTILAVERKASEAAPEAPPTPKAPVDEPVVATKERRAARPNIVSEAESALVVADRDGTRPIAKFNDAVYREADPIARHGAMLGQLAAHWNVSMDTAKAALQSAMSYVDPADGRPVRSPWMDEDGLASVRERHVALGLTRLRNASPAQVFRNLIRFENGEPITWVNEVSPARQRAMDALTAMATDGKVNFTTANVKTYMAVADRMAKALVDHGVIPDTEAFWSAKEYQGGEADKPTIGGWIDFRKDANALVTIARSGDLSTLFHEDAHLLRRIIPADQMAAVDAVAKERFGGWNRAAEEWFATQMESVIASGELTLSAKEKQRQPSLYKRLRDALDKAAKVVSAVLRGREMEPVHPEFAKWVQDYFFKSERIRPREVVDAEPVSRRKAPGMTPERVEVVNQMFETLVSEESSTARRREIHKLVNDVAYWAGLSKDEAKALHAAVKEGSDLAVLHDLAEIANGRAVDLATYVTKAAEPVVKPEFKDPQRPTKKELVAAGFVAEKGKPGLYTHPDRPERFAWSTETKAYLPVEVSPPAAVKAGATPRILVTEAEAMRGGAAYKAWERGLADIIPASEADQPPRRAPLPLNRPPNVSTIPVEYGGEFVTKPTEPTPAPVAKVEPAESKARRAMEDRLTNLVAGVQNANLATSQSRALAFLRDVARVVLEQSGSMEKVDDTVVRRVLGDATVNDYKTAVRQAYRDFKDRTGLTDSARSEAVLTASRKVLTQVGLYDPLAAAAEPTPVAPILDIIATTVTPEDKAVAKEAAAHPPLSASGSATHNQRGTRRVLVDSTGTALPVAVRRVSIDDVTPSHKLNLAWNERYDKAFQNRTDAFQRSGWLQEKVNRYNPMLAQSVDTMSPTIGAPTMWRGPDGTMHITSGNGRTLVIQLLMERAAAGDPAAQMRLQAHQAEVAAWSHALGLGTPDPRDILVFEMDAPYEAVVSFAKNSQGVPAAELSSMETVLSHADQIRHSEAVVPLEVTNLPDELDVDTVKSYIQANPTAFERALAVLWPEPSERLAKMGKGGELLVDAVQGILLGQIDRATHERMMGYGKDVVDILAACVPALVDLDRGTDTAPDLSVYRLSSYFADAVELWQSAVASGRKSPEALGKYAAERSTQTVFAGGRPLPISKLSVALAMSMMQARTPGGVARRARALVDGLARAKVPLLFAKAADHHTVALEHLTRGTGNAELIPAEIPDTHTAAQDVARKMEMTGIEARRAEDPALMTEPQGYAELKESVGATEEPQTRLLQDRRQTETPEFARWFGGSKVVDESGKPLVVYHGTSSDFTEFKAGGDRPMRRGLHGEGLWFTRNPESASEYAEFRGEGAPSVMPVYVSIRNPKEISAYDAAWLHPDDLAREGHDGAYIIENGTWVALRPEQIKSAIANVGTFDPSNPSILFHDPGEPSRTPLADQAERDIDNAIDSMMEDNPELGPDRARLVRDGVESALRSLREREYDARDANDLALAAQPSDKAAASQTYWLTDDTLREARLRFRVTLENEIRKAKATPPRPGASTRTGSDAVAARLSAERKFGSVTDADARDAARLLEMLGNPLEDAAFRVGKRVGGSATALGAYDFANDVIAIAKRAFDQGVSTRTLAHEIGHRVSMWLPKDKAQALFRQYIKERRAAIKDHPTWFDQNGHLTPEGKRDPGSYRWVDIDEWFAERFADHAHKRLRQWDAATLSVMDAARFMLEKVKARILDFFGVDRVPAVVEDLMAGRLDAVIQDAQRPVRQRLIQVQPTMGRQPKGPTRLLQDRRYPNAAEAAAATGDTLYTAPKSTDKGPRFRAAFVSWKGPAFTDTDLRAAAVNAPPDVRRVLGEWEAAILDPKNKGDASRALNAAMPTITDQGLVGAMGEAAKLMRGEVLGERPTNSYGVMISTMRAKPLLTREQLNLALGYRADQRVYDAVDLNARVAAYAVTSLLQGREMPTRYTRPGNRVAVPVTRVGAVRARALSILGDLPKRVAASVHHVTEPPSAALPNGRVEPGKAPTNRGIPEVIRLSEQDAHRFLALRDWMEDTGWADSLPLSVRRLTLEDIVRGSRYDARTGLVLGSDLTLEGWSQMVGAVMDSQSGIAPFRGKAERHSLAASLVWYVAQRVSDLDATPRDAGIVRKMLAKVRSVTSGFVLDAIANPLLPWEQYAPDMPEYVRPLYEKYARTVGRLPGDMVEALKQAIVKLEDAGAGKDTLTLAALRDLSSTLHGLDAPISVTRGVEGVSDLEILRGWLYADAVPDPNVKTNAPYRRVTGDQFVPHDLPRVTVSGGHPITNPVQEIMAHGRVVERVVRRQGTLDSNTLDAITALRDGTLDEQQAVFLLRKVQAALANANVIGLDILSSVAGRSGDADTVRKAIEARGAQGIALDAYEAFYTGDWTRQRGIAREGSIEWMSELLNKAPVKTDLWVFEVMNNLRTRWATEQFANELVDHQYVASLTDIWKMGHRDTVPDLATQAMFSERVAKAMSAILLGQDLGTTSGITAEGTRVGGMDNYTGITDVERAVAHTLIARMGMRPDLASSRKAMKGRVAGSAVTRTFSDAFYAPRSDVMKPPSERAAAAASMEGVTPTMPEMTLAGTSPIMYAPLLERMRELQAEQGSLGQNLAGVLKDRETMRKAVESIQEYSRQYKGQLISGGPNGVAAAALAGFALAGGASLPAAALAGAAGLVWSFRPRFAGYSTNAFGAVLQGYTEYGIRWLTRMVWDEVWNKKGVRASSIAARATRHSIALDRMAKPLEVVTRFIGSVVDKAYQRASDDIAFVDANGRVWTDSAIIEYGETHGLDGTQAKFESAEKARHAVDRISREYAPTTPMGQMYNAVAKFFGRHALAENYRKLYEANDTFFRYVYFTRGLMDGEAPHDALKRALNATFDYSTTAPIDRWVNSVFLFWMFQRRTVDMVLRSLVTNPHRVLGPLRFLRDQDLKSGYVEDNEDHVPVGETVPDFMAGRYLVKYMPIAGSPNAAAMKLGLQEALTVNMMRLFADVSGVDLMALMGRGRPEIQLGFNLMNSAAGNEWVSFFRKGTVQDSSYFDVPLWFVRADQTMFGGSLGKRFDWFVEPTDDPSRYAAPGYPFVYRIPPEKYAAWEIFRNTAGMATIFGNGDIDARAGGWTSIVNENVMEFIGQLDPQNVGGFRADVGDINRANGTLVPAALTGPRDFLGRENEALRNVGVGMGVVKPPYAVQADIRRQADEAAKAKLEQLRKEAPPVSPTSTPVNSDQAKPGAPMGMQPDKPMGLFK